MHEGDERRRYPRSRRGVSMITDDSTPGVLNHVDNISANGILCHTVKPVALMTRIGIVLELPIPTPRRIDAEGVVVRCNPDEKGDNHFKVAIIFTKITDEDHKAVHEFVAHDLAVEETG